MTSTVTWPLIDQEASRNLREAPQNMWKTKTNQRYFRARGVTLMFKISILADHLTMRMMTIKGMASLKSLSEIIVELINHIDIEFNIPLPQ